MPSRMLARSVLCFAFVAGSACGGDPPIPDSGTYLVTFEPADAKRPITLFIGYQRKGDSADVVVRLDNGPAGSLEGRFADGVLTVRDFGVGSRDEFTNGCDMSGLALDRLALRGYGDSGVGVQLEGKLEQWYDFDMHTGGPLDELHGMKNAPTPTIVPRELPSTGPVSVWRFHPSEPLAPTSVWFEVEGARIEGVLASTAPTHRIEVWPSTPLPWGAAVTAHLELARASGSRVTFTVATTVDATPAAELDPTLASLDGIVSVGMLPLTERMIDTLGWAGGAFGHAGYWRMSGSIDVPDTPAPRLRVLYHRGDPDFQPPELRLVVQSDDVRLVGQQTGTAWTSRPGLEPYQSIYGPNELTLDLTPLRGRRAVFALDEIAFGQCEMFPGGLPSETFIESIEVLSE